jgi:hypothetical protein
MTQEYKTKQETERYRQWLKETIESLDHSDKTAKETIPKMYFELKEQGFDKWEARGKMREDLGERWSRWSLIKFLPKEAMDPDRQYAGEQSRKKAKEKKEAEARQKNVIILEEKVVEQIWALIAKKGIRKMKIDENREVTILD